MTRPCTVCTAKGAIDVPATHVAGDADGLQWYECGQHGPKDNVAKVARTTLTPIDEWRRKHGLAT